MLYREIIAVCSQIHTKHIHTLRGQNVEQLNVKTGGTYSNHWALKLWGAIYASSNVKPTTTLPSTQPPQLKFLMLYIQW